MQMESEGDDPDGVPDRGVQKKRKSDVLIPTEEEKYQTFVKPGYKRSYPDNSASSEFPVYVEGVRKEDKIGNKNPLQLSKVFSKVKGVHEMRRLNANKIMLVFKLAAAANDFLNDKCLGDNNLKAYIPASSVERVGVVRFIPKETSNEELYNKLSCDAEIAGVRRFKKKKVGDDGYDVLTTISVTFVGTTLPQYIYLDNWRYRVWQYVPPIMQCFRCFKFNHSAKLCRNEQACSKCSGAHHYKECIEEKLKCVNCGGEHLAISKECPIKTNRIEKNRTSYASMLNRNNSYPPLPVPRSQSGPKPQIAAKPVAQQTIKPQPNKVIQETTKLQDLVKDEHFLKVIVSTLVALANSKNITTVNHVKETFLKCVNNG